jgi:hypothetical protein
LNDRDRNFGLNRLLSDKDYDAMVRGEWNEDAAPLTGPLARQIVEDQITREDAELSKTLETFLLGALMGACWAGLVALVIL